MTTQNIFDLVDTWALSGGPYTSIKMNATDNDSASASLLMDLQVGGVSKFKVSKSGDISFSNQITGVQFYNSGLILAANGTYPFFYDSTSFRASSTSTIGWTSQGTGYGAVSDTILTRRAAANLRLGAADAAGSAIAVSSVATNQLTLASSHGLTSGAAVIITGTTAPSGTSLNTLYYARSISAAVIELYLTFDTATATSGTTGIVAVTTAGTSASIRLATPFQRLSPQDFTGTDIPGQPLLINGSRGTGTGAGGSIIFQVAPAGGTGTAQNALVTALTIEEGNLVRLRPSSTTGSLLTSGDNGFRTLQLLGPTYGSNGIAAIRSDSIVAVRGSGGFAWENGGNNPATGTLDLFLYRDNSNTLALRNDNNGQTFRIYGRFTDITNNFERFFIEAPTTSGAAVLIGTQKGATTGAARALEFQTDGTTRLAIAAGGAVTIAGSLQVSNTGLSLTAVGGNGFYTNGGGYIIFKSSGVLTLTNGSDTDFGRLQFGGTTSAFPALKRVSANLQVIAADGTSSAGMIVGNQALSTTATDGFLYVPTCAGTPTGTPTTQTGTVPIVVDTSANKLYFYSGAAWRDASL